MRLRDGGSAISLTSWALRKAIPKMLQQLLEKNLINIRLYRKLILVIFTGH